MHRQETIQAKWNNRVLLFGYRRMLDFANYKILNDQNPDNEEKTGSYSIISNNGVYRIMNMYIIVNANGIRCFVFKMIIIILHCFSDIIEGFR